MFLRLLVVWAMLAPTTLCAQKAATVQNQPAALTGVWTVELHVERAASESYPKLGRGTITLRPATGPVVDSIRSYDGVAQFDLPPLDREPMQIDSAIRARLRIPPDWWRQTEAEDGPDETVRVVVNPRVDHGGLHMQGQHRGAEVIGRWVIPGYGEIASGTFRMRRDSSGRTR